MPAATDQREALVTTLGVFEKLPLAEAATKLFASLGYQSDRRIPISSVPQFCDQLDPHGKLTEKEREALVRHEHFNARSPQAKRKCRERDAELRERIADLLRQNGLPAESATKLARWDPYDQNTYASFFDNDWMFGKNHAQAALTAEYLRDGEGFDVVIGNPPYVLLQALGLTGAQLADWRERYVSAQYKVDLYQVFFEASLTLLRPGGVLAFITPNTFLKNKFSAALRKLLLTESQPLAFLLFYYPVFTGQSVDNAVSIWRKREAPNIGALSEVRSVPVRRKVAASLDFQGSRIGTWSRSPKRSPSDSAVHLYISRRRAHRGRRSAES